jgi:hypothetical protein
MKLKMALTLLCLFGIGLFARSQSSKKTKPQVENGPDAIPVTVHSNKHPHVKPPPPPPMFGKDGKPLPPPTVVLKHYHEPKNQHDKNGNPLPPPPPPPPVDKNGKPSPPPKIEIEKSKPVEMPPPPPAKPVKSKIPAPVTPDTPPIEPDTA